MLLILRSSVAQRVSQRPAAAGALRLLQHGARWINIYAQAGLTVGIYTVSRKKRPPPKQNAVTCTIYNTIQ